MSFALFEMLIQKGAVRNRSYDGEGFMGLRGLCVVGIVYCLNQDFQDYRIFRIGRGLYTFCTVGVWNVGFRSLTQPTWHADSTLGVEVLVGSGRDSPCLRCCLNRGERGRRGEHGKEGFEKVKLLFRIDNLVYVTKMLGFACGSTQPTRSVATSIVGL